MKKLEKTYPDLSSQFFGKSVNTKEHQIKLITVGAQQPLTTSIPRGRPTDTKILALVGLEQCKLQPVGLCGENTFDECIHAVGEGGTMLSDGAVHEA